MDNEIVKHEPQAEKKIISDKELIEYLDISGLTKKLTETEKKQFLQVAKIYNLNPFKREIYPVKYTERDEMTLIVGYEVYLKRAERNSQYDGEELVFNHKSDGTLESCTVTIHRKDRKFPTVKTVWLNEYIQLTDEKVWNDTQKQMVKTGKKIPTKFWQKTHTMLEKVAIAQGYRKAFPDEMGGLPYTKDELPETIDVVATETTEQSTHEPVKATVMKPTPQPIIDNYIHAVNGIKKSQNMEEVKGYWDRCDLPTQSHPSVVDEMVVKLIENVKACATEMDLKSRWTEIGKIGKGKEFQKNERIAKATAEHNLTFTKK